jgi:hypothetical protein
MAKKAPKIAQKARQAAEKWREYFQVNINEYHRMHEFILGRQWTDDEEDMLKTYKKVPLVSNKLATLANSLLGEQQQNTPQLQVVPMTNCDEEVAKLRELVVKDLMFSTNSKTCYQVAASQAFIGGFGAFAWITKYATSKSFDLDMQCIYFKDATRCYWDVAAEKINKTDGMYCGWLSRMSRAKFRDVYGKHIEEKITGDNAITASREEVALATSTQSTDSGVFNWADDEAITIQDHFVRKPKNETLYKLSNGRILDQAEMDEMIEHSRSINEQMQQVQAQQFQQQMMMGEQAGMEQAEGMPMQAEGEAMDAGALDAVDTGEDEIMTLWDNEEQVRIEDKRDTKRYRVVHQVIAGDYLLDESDFPSEQLPMPFVDQNSYYDKNGKQICRSFFADCVDTQRYINYLRTQSAYVLKVSRYDQWIGSKKNVQGNDTQQIWRDPLNVQGMLTYDESPNGDKPWQVKPPELSQSLQTQYQMAIEDLYTSTGLYPTRLGQQGNEVSGAAIDARTRQGSYPTYVAFNSINRAISTGGEIVNEMVPNVYDSERVIALMTPDEGMKNITINKQADEYGERIENDIRKGTFEVRLQAGPSYEGQKEQALQSLNMVLQANPQLLNLFADLYAENLPLMNTIEIKNRLKTIVPPAIIEAGKTGKMPHEEGNQGPSPEEQQAQMAQMEMQMKAKELELKQQELVMKAEKQQIETEREMARLETERLEVAAQLEEQKLRYMAETHRTNSDAAISHADNITKILTHKIQ